MKYTDMPKLYIQNHEELESQATLTSSAVQIQFRYSGNLQIDETAVHFFDKKNELGVSNVDISLMIPELAKVLSIW